MTRLGAGSNPARSKLWARAVRWKSPGIKRSKHGVGIAAIDRVRIPDGPPDVARAGKRHKTNRLLFTLTGNNNGNEEDKKEAGTKPSACRDSCQ
jgi:hypothetical protein